MDAFVGTAGWAVPAAHAAALPEEGSQLQRYAAVLTAAEINSSFHRPHRPQTYERWAASTPAGFRFAVKCPKHISHEARLQAADELLARFVGEAGGLGGKWAVMLVQLPPSLQFDAGVAGRFFDGVHALFGGWVVCEPRHASWFTADADQLMRDAQVARAAADPTKWPDAERPGGHPGLAYFRWHGSPRVYWSAYEEAWLEQRAETLNALSKRTARWCIFDNTASGAALGNALQLRALL